MILNEDNGLNPEFAFVFFILNVILKLKFRGKACPINKSD
jgi:hypothetical protein